MLYNIYHARKCYSTIFTIDDALQSTNPLVILKLLHVTEYEELVDDDTELPVGNKCIQGIGEAFIAEGLPHIETNLEVTRASLIQDYYKKLKADPEYARCCCER